MIFLKHEKTLYEVEEKEAKQIVKLLADNRRVPFGLQIFDPFKCEILDKLPHNYEDYEIIYINKQLGTLDKNNKERADIVGEWEAEQDKLKKQTPEQKAEREIKTSVITRYRLRTNFKSEPTPEFLEKVKQVLIEKFNENPEAIHAKKEWYEKLLP